jgi:hypothetical protein
MIEIFDENGYQLNVVDVIAEFIENESRKAKFSNEDVTIGVDENHVSKKYELIVYDFDYRIINSYPLS